MIPADTKQCYTGERMCHGSLHKTISSIYRLLFQSIFVTIFFVNIAFSQNNVLLFDFVGPNVTTEESRILTIKLKNVLEQNSGFTITPFSDLPDSQQAIPRTCKSQNEADKIIASTDFDIIIWTEVGKIQQTYLTSAYLVKSVNGKSNYSSFQDEVNGKLSDVLSHSIYNIAMRIVDKPDKVLLDAPSAEKTSISENEDTDIARSGANSDYGWIKVAVPSSQIRVFIDGEPVGSGNCDRKVAVGIHRVVAKNEREMKTDLVEVFKGDISSVSFDIGGNSDGRTVRFFMGFDASWMLGAGIEFGPSHIVGLEIDKKHLLAINYYWGVPVFHEEIYGGGFNYMYTFNVHDVFLARLGGVAGFWWEWHYDYSYYYSTYDYDDSWEALYFGGPKLRLEVGYKKVFFTIVDATLLLGTDGPKAMLNSGISFRL